MEAKNHSTSNKQKSILLSSPLSPPLSPLWQPSPQRMASSTIMKFLNFVNSRKNKNFSSYTQLYQWSIKEIPDFWKAVKEFFPFQFHQEEKEVMIPASEMRHTRWFAGAKLNFAENLLVAHNLDHGYDDKTALLEISELGKERKITYGELYARVSRWVQAFQRCGIGQGDRIVGYLPNIADTVVVMLATSSVGAIWSSCSPDFGEQGVYDRFRQINPDIIITVDGYTYKGKPLVTLPNLKKLVNDLQNNANDNQVLKKVVVIPYLERQGFEINVDNVAGKIQVNPNQFLEGLESKEISFASLPFSAPLYILYSSGTTGMPKCIMHGAGNTLIQHVKELGLHTDLQKEDVIFFHTTCGWMMWNWLVSSLFFKSTVVLYEGNPFYPRFDILMNLAEKHNFTMFGSGARYYQALEQDHKKNNSPKWKLRNLRTVLSTGSPLSSNGYRFIYQKISNDVQLSSISGGTDIISCFVLGSPILPVYQGEIQCRGLGMAVEVFDENQKPVFSKKGELVCTQPFPSMPIGFYNDPDEKKYYNAYFASIPDVWCHGDYAEITPQEGVVIYGRSDTTLNPGGVRIGTAEIYRVMETFLEVAESVAVGWENEGDSKVVLMLKLQQKSQLSREDRIALFTKIRKKIRSLASPRHVPAVILLVPDIPRTVSGKISEKAISDLINGQETKNIGALANPECLDFYRNLVIKEI